MLTQNENSKDLYSAIRSDKPPEVTKSTPYNKPKAQRKPRSTTVTRPVVTRSHLEEIRPEQNKRIIQNDEEEVETEPIQQIAKPIVKKRTKTVLPYTTYNIAEDVLDKPANITIRDLITTTPKYRRELAGACRIKRKSANIQPQLQAQTMALIEDEETNTTAVYSQTTIGTHRIKTLIDCGAAKTCISKALADLLGLRIDAPSENIFTMGNGSKQPALGIIYDVPIEVEEDMYIPCNIEVLPSCPSHLIIGNNWLNRAKARIDFQSRTLKVSYKNNKTELPIEFTKKKIPKMTSYTQSYQNPVSPTNSTPKKVRFENLSSDDSEEDITDSNEYSDEEYSTEDEWMDEETEANALLMVEDDRQASIHLINEENQTVIKAPEEGMTIKANTSSTFHINKQPEITNHITYSFEITNNDIAKTMGYFDLHKSIIINKKSIDIHLYNRSAYDIHLHPHEEIGLLEAFDLDKEEVQEYQLNKETDLFALEEDSSEDENLNASRESVNKSQYEKLEIGKIELQTEQKLKRLIHKYQEIFDWNNDTIGLTSVLTHIITIEENVQPISHRPYRLSPIKSDYLQKELDKYCKLGVIAPSNSPWAPPVILVKKKNGEYRMVIDYRKLNAITKKDSYPLPRIDDLLDALRKAKIFSALDMRAGFHQVPVADDSKELTAFTTKYGVYQYNTLPMGLVNSPATFQRLIDLCFRTLINKYLVAYIDDLNVYSNNSQEHLVHLEQVFNCIKISNLQLNLEKCFFFKDHLKFLGYIVTIEGTQTDPGKIEKIQNYPVPKTLTQIRGFLGLASYYRRFIKNFAAIARPLHDQTKTSKKVPWTDKTTNSFKLLKKLLTEAPVLVRPDFNRSFILVTDASRLGLGCILTQLDKNGQEYPIIYASRSLKSSEVNYGVSKLECLAVIWTVKLFRPYLLGRKFGIITDHSALKGLLNTTSPTGIIARWITILSEYEYDIKYRPGRINESADFMSRLGY